MISPEIQFTNIYVEDGKKMTFYSEQHNIYKRKVRRLKKVIIEGNAVYELDEECLKRREKEEKREKEKKKEGKKEKGCR